MTENIRPVSTNIIRARRGRKMARAQRGQMLIVALAILFIMLFIGGIFVAQIARNLAAAARSRDTSGSQAFAEAGVRYCADQLENSEDGADWRPVPSAPIFTTADPLGVSDPDYQWLSQGFTREYVNGGRYLVRVTYDPHPDDPRSQLIRIDSVGRTGDLEQGLDPTVFVQRGNPPRLRRELVAYKQLGLTDYVRYVTNKDRRDQEAFLGVAAIGASIPGMPKMGLDPVVIFGDPSVALHPDGVNGSELIIGGGVRVNGKLRLGSDILFYFSPRGTTLNGANVSPEGLLVSDSISLLPSRDVNNADNNADGILNDNDLQAFVNLGYDAMTKTLGGQTPNPANGIHASTDPNFSTVNGLVRDGSSSSDTNGYIRSIPRLDPPIWDTYVNGSGVLRYRALTRDSGFWVTGSYNTGYSGYGTGIYINNPGDQQHETTTPGLSGGYSLRADWLNTTGASQSHWNGPFYRAPGVLIELLGNKIRMTRNDGQVFTKPNGQPVNGANSSGGNVLEIPLADAARKQFKFPDGTTYISIAGIPPLPTFAHDGDEANDPNKPFNDKKSYGVNVVIMSEGNVRVKGVYGAVTDPNVTDESNFNVDTPDDKQLKLGRVHLNIVTGGTAYIEGNVVKGDGYVDGSGKVHLERGSTCAILAKDYVCVNTTAFQSPQNQTNAWRPTSPDLNDFYTEIGLTRPSVDTSFSFGVPVDTYMTGGNPSPLFLLVRHASQSDNTGQGQTFINLLINPANSNNPAGQGGNALYPFNQSPLLPPETYALADSLSAVAPAFERRAFDLRQGNGTPVVPTFTATPGYDNFLRFQVDNNAAPLVSGAGVQDYLYGGAMVSPLDIRIEALMYAQEKSFFVIPGYSFNPDPNDTVQNFLAKGFRPSYSAAERNIVQQGGAATPEMQAKNSFPFFNQPLDVRITICGAVTENVTASSGDQAAWLARWGYIPAQYGNSGIACPDDHTMSHDGTVNNAAWDVTYNYAEDRTGDYRTYPQQQQNITNGLRYEYDPALAMPYYRPTSMATYASVTTRMNSALRFIQRPAIMNNLNQVILPAIRQTLPPTPRLPVCPGLLYFGEGDQPVVP